MNDNDNVISVKIADRQYQVKCPPEETQSLQQAAQYLDEQMNKLRQGGSTTSVDRIAVVAALNICHEFMQLQQQQTRYIDHMNERINKLQEKVQEALATEEEVAL